MEAEAILAARQDALRPDLDEHTVSISTMAMVSVLRSTGPSSPPVDPLAARPTVLARPGGPDALTVRLPPRGDTPESAAATSEGGPVRDVTDVATAISGPGEPVVTPSEPSQAPVGAAPPSWRSGPRRVAPNAITATLDPVPRSPPAPAPSRRAWAAAAAVLAVTAVVAVAWPGAPARETADAGAAPAMDAGAVAVPIAVDVGGDAGAVDVGDGGFDAAAAPVVDAGAPTDAAEAPDEDEPDDAGPRVRKPKRKPKPPEGGALQRMLQDANRFCRAVPPCAGLPATVDANATSVDELLSLRQRAKACLAACGRWQP
jgi:hypothetical protein